MIIRKAVQGSTRAPETRGHGIGISKPW